MTALATLALPLFVVAVLVTGAVKRVPVFDEFCAGAREGLRAAVGILPSLAALITAVAMLRASGFTDWLVTAVSPLAAVLGFPAEALPSALLRPLSGSGSLAALRQVLADCGTESAAGLVASVLQCSTETTFYTLTVYFGAVGIRKTAHALPAAMVGDMAGMVLAALSVRLFLL